MWLLEIANWTNIKPVVRAFTSHKYEFLHLWMEFAFYTQSLILPQITCAGQIQHWAREDTCTIGVRLDFSDAAFKQVPNDVTIFISSSQMFSVKVRILLSPNTCLPLALHIFSRTFHKWATCIFLWSHNISGLRRKSIYLICSIDVTIHCKIDFYHIPPLTHPLCFVWIPWWPWLQNNSITTYSDTRDRSVLQQHVNMLSFASARFVSLWLTLLDWQLRVHRGWTTTI